MADAPTAEEVKAYKAGKELKSQKAHREIADGSDVSTMNQMIANGGINGPIGLHRGIVRIENFYVRVPVYMMAIVSYSIALTAAVLMALLFDGKLEAPPSPTSNGAIFACVLSAAIGMFFSTHIHVRATMCDNKFEAQKGYADGHIPCDPEGGDSECSDYTAEAFQEAGQYYGFCAAYPKQYGPVRLFRWVVLRLTFVAAVGLAIGHMATQPEDENLPMDYMFYVAFGFSAGFLLFLLTS